ncbi:hypothetical protein N7492_000073 [Penicillium capsulatum]|uniref:Uncharacterized protein n=1 Tax=Penicillium capsulatum TaxID=69766 RepID=A0A9W9IR50_9EURO|nr:hypothetical protein N7492_000073 [Penicillium capsulatum]KAJ6130854.1 hypothetical protein N7512_003634 [Penicillium capsulatum]
MPAHYAALPDGRVLKDAGLPDLVNPPYLEPRREFAFYSRYYKNVFNPSGFWPIWNRCCMIRHLQKERRVTYREHLELQLILNQIQKYKKLGGGKLKAWNQELLPEIPDVEFFEEDAEGNLRLRSQRRSRGLKKE